MTIKLLHHTIRKRGGYEDGADIGELLLNYGTNLIVFDVCAVWMTLLKSEKYACLLLQSKLCENGMSSLDFIFLSVSPKLNAVSTVNAGLAAASKLPYSLTSPRIIIRSAVAELLEMVRKVKEHRPVPWPIRSCFVVDGQPLPAKKFTHQSRARTSRSHLKCARRLCINYLGKPAGTRLEEATKFRKQFRACAAGWLRWFPDLKQLLVEELIAFGASDGFDPNGTSEFSVVRAPFEADPVCVYVAHHSSRSMLFSCDGDLLIYPFANHSPRITKINWDTCRATFTTIPTVLTALELLPQGGSRNEADWTVARLRLLVSACMAGTDYCQNIRGKSFGTSRAAAASIEGVSEADVLLEKVWHLNFTTFL